MRLRCRQRGAVHYKGRFVEGAGLGCIGRGCLAVRLEPCGYFFDCIVFLLKRTGNPYAAIKRADVQVALCGLPAGHDGEQIQRFGAVAPVLWLVIKRKIDVLIGVLMYEPQKIRHRHLGLVQQKQLLKAACLQIGWRCQYA